MKEELNKCQNIPHSWIPRLTIKMTILTKVICKFNANSLKTPRMSFAEIKKSHPKIHMESQETPK